MSLQGSEIKIHHITSAVHCGMVQQIARITGMIAAMVLAAGLGQRLEHRPKALLRRCGQSFLACALQELQRAGVDQLILVTGAYRNQLLETWTEQLSLYPKGWAREVFHPDFALGQLSSIQAGLRELSAEVEAVLITLVDLPLLEAGDYREVMDAWRGGPASALIRPYWDDQPSHPVLIPRVYFTEILAQPVSDRGCAFLFQKHPESLVPLAACRGHGSIDIDTLEDYHAHITP